MKKLPTLALHSAFRDDFGSAFGACLHKSPQARSDRDSKSAFRDFRVLIVRYDVKHVGICFLLLEVLPLKRNAPRWDHLLVLSHYGHYYLAANLVPPGLGVF